MSAPCPDEQVLVAFVAGALSIDEASSVEQHLETCEACAEVIAASANVGPECRPAEELAVEAEGRYELRRELGEGAEARVWLAWDHHLGRAVALKIAHRDALRPLQEARLVAQLDHPGIVTVFEIGRRADGTLYSAQRLVEARRGPRSLREAFSQTTTLEERLRLVPRLHRVCEALGNAHANGVVHRDLKPEHVVLGDDGETVVIDWGLAVRLTESVAMGVVGTPGYRSPEQEDGRAVSARSDVFSLGVMLAECLEVGPVEQRPAPLVAVAARAQSVDPAARYADARALADELSAWLSGGVVRAHDYALSELVRRAFQRHRAALVFLVLLALTSGAAAWSIARSRAETRRALATTLLEKAALVQRGGGWDEAALLAAAADGLAPSEAARLWFSATADRSTRVARHTVWGDRPVTALGWNASTRRLVAGSATGALAVISPSSPGPWLLDGGHRGAVTAVRFSLDGAKVYSTGADRQLLEWDVRSGSVRSLREGRSELDTLAIDPRGEWVAVGDEEGGLELVEPVTGATVARWRAHAVPLYAVEVSKDGTWLATGDWSGTVRRWSRDGGLLAELTGHQDAVTSLSSSPEGVLASSSRDRSVRVWREGTRAPLVLTGHQLRVRAVAWLDARRLQSLGDDGQLRTWELHGRDGGLDEWQCVAVEQLGTPGKALVSTPTLVVAAGDDGALTRFELPLSVRAGLPWRERISHLDGDVDAGVSLVEDYDFVRRDVRTGQLLGRRASPHHAAAQVRQLPDGRRVWIGYERPGEPALYLEGLDGGESVVDRVLRATSIVLDPEARWVGVLGASRDVRLHSLERPDASVVTLRGHGSDVFAVTLGRTIAVTGCYDTMTRVFELPSGRPLFELDGHWQGVRAVALSFDEALVASGSWDQSVRLWSSRDGTPAAVLREHQSPVTALAFSPNGRWLASASTDGTLIVWELATKRPLVQLANVENMPRVVRWLSHDVLLVGGTRFSRVDLGTQAGSMESVQARRGLEFDGTNVRYVDFGEALVP